MNTPKFTHLIVLSFLLAACGPAATATSPATDIPAPTATSSYDWPQGSGECTLTAAESVEAYSRPSSDAALFGSLEAGFSTPVGERTADGWVGFDPGVAQAANMGIFRLRWVRAEDVTLSGDCAGLPVADWVPQPGICYFQPMEEAAVYTQPDNSEAVVTRLQPGQYAAVEGQNQAGWSLVNLAEGNSGATGSGWVEQSSLNMNGASCGELPTINP